jgi:ankyrin repeat protein
MVGNNMSFWTKLFGAKRQSPLMDSTADIFDDLYGPRHSVVSSISRIQMSSPKITTASAEEIRYFFFRVEFRDWEEAKVLLKDNPGLTFSRNNFGWTPLHIAAAKGRKDVAELLLINNADVNARVENGWSPLHHAVYNGHKDVVESLLAHKADVNLQDNEGCTPLHYAAKHNSKDLVELLLASKADVNVKDNEGWTPLRSGPVNGVVAELLRAHGGHAIVSKDHAVGGNIHWGARDGNLSMVEALIKDDPDLVLSKDGSYGRTPLHWASINGHTDIVALMLTKKADINVKDNHGRTPLHYAASNILFTSEESAVIYNVEGMKEVAKLLLAKKADVNVRDNDGRTPLHYAAHDGRLDMVELLLVNNAMVNAKDNCGATPLHNAASISVTTEVMELLLAKKADINAKDDNGRTPLNLAAMRYANVVVACRCSEVAAFLYHHGGIV